MRRLSVCALVFAITVASQAAISAEARKGAPLSKAEAVAVATRFFVNEIDIEGAVGEPVEAGDYWAFPVKFGYAGHVAPDPILVNRLTGQPSWAGLAAHNARFKRNKAQSTK
jgi:hypothetical protein